MRHRYTTDIPRQLPLMGVDLGYSATARSCGLAWDDGRPSDCLAFGECIDCVHRDLQDTGPKVLILEAVLSTFHNPNGNPAIRGDFEKGRGWYHGPGVSTFAAALRFLQRLDKMLPIEVRPIPLVEGFLSYKPTRTAHTDDACRLVIEFHSAEMFRAAPGSEPICELIDGVPEIRRYNPRPS